MFSFCVDVNKQKVLAYHLEGLCVPQIGNHWCRAPTIDKLEPYNLTSGNSKFIANILEIKLSVGKSLNNCAN